MPWTAVHMLSGTDALHHGEPGQRAVSRYHTRAETGVFIRGSSDAAISNMVSGGFASSPIDLGTKSSVGRFLENRCMFSLEYDAANLPADDDMFSDPKKAKKLYL